MYWHGLLAAVGIILISVAGSFAPSEEKARLDFYAPPRELKHFTLGYDENLADAMWIRVIQNLDTCESVPEGQAHSDERVEARKHGEDAPACKQGWVYKMLDSVTTLAPKFMMPYVAGGVALSILVDDREGASIILERGVKQFPTDWDMAFRSGYHFLVEVKDQKKAAEYLLQAVRNGAPHWIYATVGRLNTEAGKALVAKQVYLEALERDPDGPGTPRIKAKLKEIEETLRNEHKVNLPTSVPSISKGPRANALPSAQQAPPDPNIPQFLRKSN